MSDHGRRATLRVAWRRCLLCCVLALLAGHSPSATSGPLPLSPPNGGFEDGLRAWRPDRVEGVSAGDVTLVAAGAAEGKQCVCLTGTTARPLIGLTSDPVAVPRGGAYLRLRFRYRTLGEPDELVVRLRPLDEKGQGLTPPANYRYVYLPLLPSAAWQEASLGCLLAPEAVAYDVGFWLRGEGALLVDAVTVQTLGVGDGGVPARGARIQGAHQDAVQVWCESPLKRVYRDTPAPAAEVAAIELAAARGECEPVQVVIVPRADAARVRVRWQDFLGPSVLPREIGRSAWVDYLEVTRTQAPLGRTGWVPDVLDPEDTRDLKGGQVQPIWLTLKVPRNARPGLYQGAVQIESRPRDHWAPPSLPTLRIPIRLRVRDFALPEEPTLTALVGIDQCPPQGREPLRRNLRQHRVSGESFVGPLPVRIAADGTVQVEFAAFDTAAADYFRTGLRLFAIPGVVAPPTPPNPGGPHTPPPLVKQDAILLIPPTLGGQGGPHTPPALGGQGGASHPPNFGGAGGAIPDEWTWNGLRVGSPEFRQAFSSYVRQVATHLREKGWLSQAVLRLWEGPLEEETRAVAQEMVALARAAAPDLRLLATPGVAGADIWCLPLPLGFRATVLRARGDAALWAREDRLYALDADSAAIDLRGYPWRLKRCGITGVEWPALTRWNAPATPTPPADPGEWEGRLAAAEPPPGWGVLIHPGRAEGAMPRDSIRWELYREGVEDYDALTLLEQAYVSARDALRVQDPRFEAAALIEHVTRPVASSIVESTLDPARLHSARAFVDHLIEFLSAEPPCVFRFAGEGETRALEGVTLPAVTVESGRARVAVDAAGRFRVPLPAGGLRLTVRSGRQQRELVIEGGW